MSLVIEERKSDFEIIEHDSDHPRESVMIKSENMPEEDDEDESLTE